MRGTVAQRMPVPAWDVFAESVSIPPGMPVGGKMDPVADAGSVNIWVEGLNLNRCR